MWPTGSGGVARKMRESHESHGLSSQHQPLSVMKRIDELVNIELNDLYSKLCRAKSVCLICGSNFGRYVGQGAPPVVVGTCDVCRRGGQSTYHVSEFNYLRDGMDNVAKQLFGRGGLGVDEVNGMLLESKSSKLVGKFLDVCEKSGLGGEEDVEE